MDLVYNAASTDQEQWSLTAMIQNAEQYRKALEELHYMEEWLGRLQSETQGVEKGLTKAGIRKMIARLQDELAAYEGQQEVSAALAAR